MDDDRRRFLKELSALGLALAAARALPACASRLDRSAPASAFAGEQLAALEAVTEHVLPEAPEDPGARSAGCAAFVNAQLADPRFSMLRRVLGDGLQEVERLARDRGAAGFAALDEEGRDDVLRTVQRTERAGMSGERFMRVLVVLTLEGFLSHPRHGGNRGEVGWRLVGFLPVRWGPQDARAWREERT